MSIKIIILGLPPGGLFLVRQLRKEYPESVIYAICNSHDVGKYSNAINRVYEVNANEEIKEIIQQAYIDIGKGKVYAYMCSNPMLEYVIGHYSEVFDFIQFENDINTYRKLVDKRETESLCRNLNIPRPTEFTLTDRDIEAISYPVVIKPLEKGHTIGAGKCVYISDEIHLNEYLLKIDSLRINRELLICQQCIKGDNRWEYGYGGFFRNGNPVVDISFYQFRQVPQGLCCYTTEISDSRLKQQIQEIVSPVLHETNYTGFIEFDIKQDEESKQLFLLDINPRPWRSSDMLKAKIGNSTIYSPQLSGKKVIWRYPYRELYSRKNHMNVPYSKCKEISAIYDTKTQLSIYDNSDLKPFLIQMKNDLKSLLSTIKNKLS